MDEIYKSFVGDSFKKPPAHYLNTIITQLFRIKVVQIEMVLDRGYQYYFNTTDDNADNNDRVKYNQWEIDLAKNARITRENRLESTEQYADIKTFEDFYKEKAETNTTHKTDIPDFVGALSNIYIKTDEDDNGEKYNRILYVRYLSVPVGKKKLSKEQSLLIHNEINFYQQFFTITDLIVIGAAPFATGGAANIKNIYQKRDDGVNIPINYEFFLQKKLTYNPTKHILYDEHKILSKRETIIFLENNRKGGRNINLMQLPAIDINDIIVRYFGAKIGDIIQIKSRGHIGSIVLETIDYKIVNSKKMVDEETDESTNEAE